MGEYAEVAKELKQSRTCAINAGKRFALIVALDHVKARNARSINSGANPAMSLITNDAKAVAKIATGIFASNVR